MDSWVWQLLPIPWESFCSELQNLNILPYFVHYCWPCSEDRLLFEVNNFLVWESPCSNIYQLLTVREHNLYNYDCCVRSHAMLSEHWSRMLSSALTIKMTLLFPASAFFFGKLPDVWNISTQSRISANPQKTGPMLKLQIRLSLKSSIIIFAFFVN